MKLGLGDRMKTNNIEKGNRELILGVILCVMLLGIAFVNMGSGLCKAQNEPRPIMGFVLDENGDPVEGADVIATSGVFTATYHNATDETGFYDLTSPSTVDGDAVLVVATFEDLIGSEIWESESGGALFFNITIGEPSITVFNLVVFTFDENGAGVANSVVSILDILGVYHNVTTNSTGYATISGLIPGAYSYTVGTILAGLNNHTGSVNVVDRDVRLNIDLSQVQSAGGLEILGFGISSTCMVIMALIFVAGLGWLFIVLIRGRR
jgi:hypothetical protein